MLKYPLLIQKDFLSGKVINTLSKKRIKLNITAVYTVRPS